MTYQLYFTPGACSLAPHIVLREAGAKFDLVQVDLKSHTTKDGRDFYVINPKGYTPALGLPNGELLTEGPAITQYVADSVGATALAPKSGTLERARVNEWLTFIGTEIHKSFSPLFNPASDDATKKQAKDKLAGRFSLVEKTLADGRSYLTGETFTIADAYLFTVANWSGNVGVDLSPFPKLQAYQARVLARPHTQAAMKAEGLI